MLAAALAAETATPPASAPPVLGGVEVGSAGLPWPAELSRVRRGLRARRSPVRGRRGRRARVRRTRRGRRGSAVPTPLATRVLVMIDPVPIAASARIGRAGAPAASLMRNSSDLRWLADTHDPNPGSVDPLSLEEMGQWRCLESVLMVKRPMGIA